MSEENNNQSFPADNREKSPVIIIEGKTSGSSHKICKSIGKVLLTIGSIITFARNLVFNLIFLLLIFAILSGIYFANNAKDIVENTAVNADGSVKTVSPILYLICQVLFMKCLNLTMSTPNLQSNFLMS